MSWIWTASQNLTVQVGGVKGEHVQLVYLDSFFPHYQTGTHHSLASHKPERDNGFLS